MLWRVGTIKEASTVEVIVRAGAGAGVPVEVEVAGRHQALVLDIYLAAHLNLALARGHLSIHAVKVFHTIRCMRRLICPANPAILFVLSLLHIKLLLFPQAQLCRKAFPPFFNKWEIPQ